MAGIIIYPLDELIEGWNSYHFFIIFSRINIIFQVLFKIEATVIDEDPIKELKKFVVALDNSEKEFAKPFNMFRSLIYEYIRLLNKYKVEDPPPK